jgi:hypothetical protein
VHDEGDERRRNRANVKMIYANERKFLFSGSFKSASRSATMAITFLVTLE